MDPHKVAVTVDPDYDELFLSEEELNHLSVHRVVHSGHSTLHTNEEQGQSQPGNEVLEFIQSLRSELAEQSNIRTEIIWSTTIRTERSPKEFFSENFFIHVKDASMPEFLENGSLITHNSVILLKGLEPLKAFGTSNGFVYLCPLFYQHRANEKAGYEIHRITFDQSEIRFIYARKSLLILSSSSGKIGVYRVKREQLLNSAQHVVELRENESCNDITERTKVFENKFVSPLKRLLKLKVLRVSDLNARACQDQYSHFIKTYKHAYAFILRNNSIVLYSNSHQRVINQLKCNEDSVLGIFLHPLFDYAIILAANGSVNVWSLNSNRLERVFSFPEFVHQFQLVDFLKDYDANFLDLHQYSFFKNLMADEISKSHSILEYLSRSFDCTISYLNAGLFSECFNKLNMERHEAASPSPHRGKTTISGLLNKVWSIKKDIKVQVSRLTQPPTSRSGPDSSTPEIGKSLDQINDNYFMRNQIIYERYGGIQGSFEGMTQNQMAI
jgi:WD40 repeat protein